MNCTVVWLSCVAARARVLYVHGESVQVVGGVVFQDAVLYSSGPSLNLSLSLDGRRRVRVSTCIPVQWVYRC